MRGARLFSLRTRLLVFIVLVIITGLVPMASFVVQILEKEQVARLAYERRALELSALIADAIRPDLAANDIKSVNTMLGSLAQTRDAIYAVVRRDNGALLAGWKPELAAGELPRDKEKVTVSYAYDRLRVDAPVHARPGLAATLSIGLSMREILSESHKSRMRVALTSIVVVAIGLVMFLFGTLVIRSISNMTSIARRIADGDLANYQQLATGDDEIGQMAEAFNRMVEGQRTMVKQIADTSVQLAVASAQLYSAAQEQEAATAKQSAGVEEVSRTMQTLLDSAAYVADSARGVLANAERSKETADATSGRISELNRHTSRIAEILEIIRDIADRSDLLALNASLEATRAGEAGRAFSLVAAEVRRLAERVTASVADVKSLVADVRAFSTSAVLATEEGSKLTDSTTESARQITVVTQQQRTGTEQVSESMRHISNLLSQSLVATQKTRSSVAVLKMHAERLSDLIGKFQMGTRETMAGV